MALDPAGHIRIAVSDLSDSIIFYERLFEQLRYRREREHAWVTPYGLGFWLIQAEYPEPKHTHGAPGLHHFCFPADMRSRVDTVYYFLREIEVAISDPPRDYPEYVDDGEEYYAVFFYDPDGIKLEVAYHK